LVEIKVVRGIGVVVLLGLLRVAVGHGGRLVEWGRRSVGRYRLKLDNHNFSANGCSGSVGEW
jgi:hypothetical protein